MAIKAFKKAAAQLSEIVGITTTSDDYFESYKLRLITCHENIASVKNIFLNFSKHAQALG
jgi:hypothetical protein